MTRSSRGRRRAKPTGTGSAPPPRATGEGSARSEPPAREGSARSEPSTREGSERSERATRDGSARSEPPARDGAASLPSAHAGSAGAAREARGLRRLVGGLRGAFAAWVTFWDRREPATSLALVRILVAVVLLGDLVQAYAYGLVEAIWGPPPEGLGWGGQGNNAPLAARWLGASADTAWIVWGTGVISALTLAAGAASRVSAFVLAFTWAQLGLLAPDSDRGIDFLLRGVLLILALSPCGARWSIDAWLRRRIGRPFPDLVPAWPRYLLFLQLIWCYFSAGHNKTDKAWGPLENFAALGNILTDPHFARFDPAWVAPGYPLLQLATASTMLFELGSPLMILLTYWSATAERPGQLRRWANRLRLRWLWIATGVGFHVGIAVTMRLGIFPWGLLALYPVLFHPDELSRAGAWLRSRLRRGA